MMTALIVAEIFSWIVILGLALCLLALARQVGVLHMRVAPAGALTPAEGPAVGQKSPRLSLAALNGAKVEIGEEAGRMQLLLFVSPHCPICKDLIPVAKSFARSEELEIVFIGDDNLADQRALIARAGIERLPFVNSAKAGRTFHVDKLPHAVLIGRDGVILAKGLVNSREHLESLVVSHEMGIKSVQDYLTRKSSAA